MKKTILISAAFLMFAGNSFSQVLWTPGATVGNNTTNQYVGIGTSTPVYLLNDVTFDNINLKNKLK